MMEQGVILNGRSSSSRSLNDLLEKPFGGEIESVVTINASDYVVRSDGKMPLLQVAEKENLRIEENRTS